MINNIYLQMKYLNSINKTGASTSADFTAPLVHSCFLTGYIFQYKISFTDMNAIFSYIDSQRTQE